MLSIDYMSSGESLSEPDSQDAGDTSGSDEDVPKTKKTVCTAPSLAQCSRKYLNGLLCSENHQKRIPRSNWMSMEQTVGPPSTREAPEDAPEFALAALH